MPSYKTHSIHGEIVLKQINSRIKIDNNDIKIFSIGPDILTLSDYKLFYYQHDNKAKDYFLSILNYIKQNNLQYNSQVMAFVYGQIDHYILDLTTHPIIYYFTECVKNPYKVYLHGLVEMWLDNYFMNKYDVSSNKYYLKLKIKDQDLVKLINNTYFKVFNKKKESKKYQKGINRMLIFDNLIRNNKILIGDKIMRIFNTGNIVYKNDITDLSKFISLEKIDWIHPETGEQFNCSLLDLSNKSIEESVKTIEDVNKFLYDNEVLNNYYINNDISYDTGLPCIKGQKNTYAKK